MAAVSRCSVALSLMLRMLDAWWSSACAQGKPVSSAAEVADSDARLAEIRAEATRRADVAAADASRAILEKEREEELARLAKSVIAPEEIRKQQVEIAAEATAERSRREASGEADAIIARYNAEAEGVRKVLEAKADGYRELIVACAENPQIAPTLLLIEQLPELVREQVKAISNLQIDKITVWDGGRGEGGRGSTSDFLSGLIGSLPPMHELAEQAGIELPGVLGKVGASSTVVETEPVEQPDSVNDEA